MDIDWIYLLVILLPVAAASGWWAARTSNTRAERNNHNQLHPEYFKGLNYVLNEQPDKAIEIFIRMLEVDSDTIETHLALGNLFRRRGEVDRAIRIHQNLIARPDLNRSYKAQALLELGLDYMRLGILDRAEGLFSELVASDMLSVQAQTHLLEIYQQERDWEKAIITARQLKTASNKKLEPVMSQFYCELAGMELENHNDKGAKHYIKRALKIDPKCVRASIMEGILAKNSGQYRAAINAFRRIETQDPAYLYEVIQLMRDCYDTLSIPEKYTTYLQEILLNHGGITPLLYLTDDMAKKQGDDAAIRFLSDELRKRPTVRGVNHLMKYTLTRTDGELNKDLATIKELTSQLLEDRPVYECNVCGFSAKTLHWHCPGCRNWNSVKPVYGVYGE